MEYWAWNGERSTQSLLYEIDTTGPQKLPNFGIWEEGKSKIGNIE